MKIFYHKPLLTVYEVEVELKSNWHSQSFLDEQILRDGRSASKFVEQLAQSVIPNFKRHKKEKPGYDGCIGSKSVEVRCLTKGGVKFQYSRDIGGSRNCKNLLAAVRARDSFIVADIVESPVIRMLQLDAKTVGNWILDGHLDKHGFSHDDFWEKITQEFRLKIVCRQPLQVF